jgi:hypothetical protein
MMEGAYHKKNERLNEQMSMKKKSGPNVEQ